MMSEHDRAGVDISAFLAEGRDGPNNSQRGILTDSWAKRGGFAQLLVKELSKFLAVRDEVLRPVLRELQDGHSHLRRLDDARIRQLDLLAQLDDLSIGVGPRDVHQREDNGVEAPRSTSPTASVIFPSLRAWKPPIPAPSSRTPLVQPYVLCPAAAACGRSVMVCLDVFESPSASFQAAFL